MSLTINKPQVVHEVFDDEVVIINLDTGNYYSLEGAGAAIWGFIENGASVPEIMRSVNSLYAGDNDAIQRAITALLDELQQEALISPSSDAGQAGESNDEVSDEGASDEKIPFKTPVLTRFTDMQELLLLDPVHEVDETGWPAAKAALPTND